LIFFIIPFNLKNRVAWIQRSYLIWYKHKLYFHTHWQLFLLQIHPYIIVWYIFQMALFLFCQIITNLWYWDLVKTLRPKLEISKLVDFAETFQRIIITTLKLNFFKFLEFFQSVLVVSYLLIQQRTHWVTEVLQSHILAILTVSRQQACDRDL